MPKPNITSHRWFHSLTGFVVGVGAIALLGGVVIICLQWGFAQRDKALKAESQLELADDTAKALLTLAKIDGRLDDVKSYEFADDRGQTIGAVVVIRYSGTQLIENREYEEGGKWHGPVIPKKKNWNIKQEESKK